MEHSVPESQYVDEEAGYRLLAFLLEILPIQRKELVRLQRDIILKKLGGNKTHAAKALGICLRTIRNEMNVRKTDPFSDFQKTPEPHSE